MTKVDHKLLTLSLLEKSKLNKAVTSQLEQLITKEPNLNGALIARLYEDTVSRDVSKKQGIYYTPFSTALLMARRVAARWPCSMALPRIIDPACGSGIMLIAILRALSEQGASSDALKAIAHELLLGIDRDADAVAVARIAVALEVAELIDGESALSVFTALNERIVCADTLLDEHPLLTPGIYDVVVSNPPYGLSRDGRISADENLRLKERYAAYALGKTNHYLLFMARGRELLASRGILSYIVPNSWLGIRSAKSLRRLLLETGELSEIISYDYSVFGAPGVESISFILDRQTSSDAIHLYRQSSSGAQLAHTGSLPHQFCVRLPDAVIPHALPSTKVPFIETVLRAPLLLGSPESPFIAQIALQAYARGKGVPPQSKEDVTHQVYHCTDEQATPDSVPYLDGSDVTRYHIRRSGKRLRYGPWLAEFPPIARFEGARVLIREITNRLPYFVSAAVTEERMVYNRSVLHIICKPGVDADAAWALAALLNSKTASEILFYLGRKTQRALFPKLVNDDLKTFPLPANFIRAIPELAILSRQLQRLTEETASGLTDSSAELRALNDRVDSIAHTLYFPATTASTAEGPPVFQLS